MLIATLSYSKQFEIISLQRKESTTKSNVSSKMLFILQGLRELTLPLLTDTEITCTGVDMGKLSERGSKTSLLRKVDVGLRG